MSIEVHRETLSPERALVRVRGELDLNTAPELTAALEGARADGQRAVVLDLTDVEFIDTSGIGAMLDARSQNAGLTVIAPPDSPARRLLELTELVEALAVIDSLENLPADGS